MSILLIDFDSKIPNLALMKLSAYFKEEEEIGFAVEDPNKVYVSVVFKENKPQAAGLRTLFPDAEVVFGGPGWDLKSELPEEIEMIRPDYNLYPHIKYSMGFSTRGCPRKCPFCVVPVKEGKIRINQHPNEFHDSRFDTCMLLDNNLLAADPDWLNLVLSWFETTKTKIMIPQGLDARLLSREMAERLHGLRHVGRLHFAWDNLADEEIIFEAVEMLADAGFDLRREISFYVLCGYTTGIDDDVYRVNALREAGVQSFVMRYKKTPELNALARWANRPWLYWSFPFREYTRKLSPSDLNALYGSIEGGGDSQ